MHVYYAFDNNIYYAGTSLSCAGIQRWKSVSFHCWAAINLVGDMSNEEEDPHPTIPIGHQELRVQVTWAMRRRTTTPTHPTPLVIRSWQLKWHEQWGGVLAYWDPSSLASSLSSMNTWIFLVWQTYIVSCIYANNFGNCTHMYNVHEVLSWQSEIFSTCKPYFFHHIYHLFSIPFLQGIFY